MAGVSVSYLATFSIFTLGITIIYFRKILFILDLKKGFWLVKNYSPSFTLVTAVDVYKLVVVQVAAMLCFKLMPLNWLMRDRIVVLNLLVLLIIIVLLTYFSSRLSKDVVEMNLLYLILIFFFVAVSSFYFVENYMVLFLALELVGVIYYFFFLHNLTGSKLTTLRYKNLLSNYLWVSFFLLVVLSIFMFYLTLQAGSLNFEELVSFSDKTPRMWQFIILITLWKTGSPGFHFLKFELYQYLPILTLLVFSTVSIFLNFFILQFIASVAWPILVTQKFYFLIYISIMNIILLVRGFSAATVYQFFGLSALNTLLVLFTFFLV